MKTTTRRQEKHLIKAEKKLREAVVLINIVRAGMNIPQKLNENCRIIINEDSLEFKEYDALFNSTDCICSAINYLYDVEE